MIYDLGCLGQTNLLAKIATELIGATSVFGIIAGLAVMGAIPNRSLRFRSYDIFSGWGFVAAAMTLCSILFQKALPLATLVIYALIVIALIPALKRRYFVSPFWILALFPGLLILAAINGAGVAKWDDFSQWVPNALYLFKNNSLPTHELPSYYSGWPGYPYALPFLTYLASWLANGFLMQGGAMINFLLFMAFAAMLAEKPENPDAKALSLSAIGKIALAAFVVTIGNPYFNASFSVTNQGDTGTMILTGAAGILLWRMIGFLQKKNRDAASTLIAPITLIFLALVLLKQSNMVLVILLLFAFIVTAAKNREFKLASITALIIFLPPLIMRLIWQHYVNTEIAGNGFALHAFSAWRFDLIGPLLHSILQEMIKKNGAFLLIIAVTIAGIASFFRSPTPLRNFTLMAAIVYVGYYAFLVMIYIGASFTEDEIRRAASFYRYSTHTGLLGIALLWFFVEEKIKSPLKSKAVWFAAIALLPFVYFIRPSWIVPEPDHAACMTRQFGNAIAEKLPPQSHLAVVDPLSNGLETYIINFELALNDVHTGNQSRVVAATSIYEQEKPLALLAQINADKNVSAVLLRRPTPELERFFGVTAPQPQYLFVRKGSGWRDIGISADDVP